MILVALPQSSVELLFYARSLTVVHALTEVLEQFRQVHEEEDVLAKDELLPYEMSLMQAIFKGRNEVLLSGLKDLPS